MFRNKAKWLGVGAVALGLSLPFAAQAHGDEEAMAFIVGAAVGYAIGDDRDKHRHVHYRGHPRSWHGHSKPYKDYGYHRKAHKHWSRSHREWHRDRYAYRGHHRDRHYRDHHYRDHHYRDRHYRDHRDHHGGDRHRDGGRRHDRDGRGGYHRG